MSQKTVSTLSGKHIVISILLIVCVRLLAILTDRFVVQEAIALMFGVNICTAALIVYNWKLIERHTGRINKNPGDTLLFTAIGIAAYAVWAWISVFFLKADMMLPENLALIGIGYARPGMMIAFSIMEACMLNIGFKNLTDRLDVRNKELQAILFSAVLFGLLMTVVFTPFQLLLWIRTYLYWLITTAILSYLYNQSHSIIPGIVAVTLVHLAIMILSML
jgi:hypothetical protein